jgi:putative transposase
MSVQPLQFLLLVFAGWVNRRQLEVIDYLKEENRVLREQLHGRRLRFTDEQRRRLTVRGKALGRRVLRDVTSLLTPDTILRCYRQLIAAKYDGTAERGAGRPRTAVPVQDLVVKFATENPGWGYTRLRGALGNLGHVIDRNTIKRILNEHGLQPAPERRKRMPWKTFIKAHLGAIAAMDFFTVEVLTLAGLVRYHVLFVIDIQTRRVHIAGIVRQPHGAHLAVGTLPSGYCDRRLQVHLGCIQLSLSCPFRLVRTVFSPRPTRRYPRLWIQRSSSERRRDFKPS